MLGGAVNSPVIGSRVTVELHRAAVAQVAVGSNVPLPRSVDGLKPANLSAFSLAMVLCTVTYGSAAGRLMNDLVRRTIRVEDGHMKPNGLSGDTSKLWPAVSANRDDVVDMRLHGWQQRVSG